MKLKVCGKYFDEDVRRTPANIMDFASMKHGFKVLFKHFIQTYFSTAQVISDFNHQFLPSNERIKRKDEEEECKF